ncbi:MAG TPA: hypothetical protein VGH00_07085 [Chthoniobacterales bacterium]
MKTQPETFSKRLHRLFQPRMRRQDPRGALPEGMPFSGTGWIGQPVHVPVSLRRLALVERAAAARRSGDRMLVLNLSSFNYLTGWDRMLAKDEYERRRHLQ